MEEQLAAAREARRKLWQQKKQQEEAAVLESALAAEAAALAAAASPQRSPGMRASARSRSPRRASASSAAEDASAGIGGKAAAGTLLPCSPRRPGETAGEFSERIFEALCQQRSRELAAQPFVPQTIMDLLEDAPERPPPEPTEADIAGARMRSLRLAYAGQGRATAGSKVAGEEDAFIIESWNIDGLDQEHGFEDMLARHAGVVKQLLEAQPAVVYFQEVVDQTLEWLRVALDDRYIFVTPEPKVVQYFVVVLVSRTQVARVRSTRTVSFPKSRMGRQALIVEAELHGGKSATFMTSHLESTKECSTERKAQLKLCCELLRDSTSDLVAFAGDLNVRDAEAKAVLSKFPEVKCAWEHCGSSCDQKFTWDTRANDNCGITGPRCRFDRLSFSSRGIAPSGFQLAGKERLPHGRFASDHWAILSRWPVPTSAPGT